MKQNNEFTAPGDWVSDPGRGDTIPWLCAVVPKLIPCASRPNDNSACAVRYNSLGRFKVAALLSPISNPNRSVSEATTAVSELSGKLTRSSGKILC